MNIEGSIEDHEKRIHELELDNTELTERIEELERKIEALSPPEGL